jgi:nucleotide-binding universal stress UspA family protein
MFHSILVPLDGSTLAEQALPLAAAVAEQNEASLSLAVVHPWGPAENAPRPGTHADREIREAEGTYLNRLMQEVASAYHIPVCEAVLDGSATGHTLVEYARRRKIDLVVASTHDHGALGRFLSSGLARHLAHQARASVLFIKPQAGPLPIGLGGFRRVLVALDGSPDSEAALLPAAALAAGEKAVITLVRVIAGAGEALDQARAEARSYLERLLPHQRQRGGQVQTRVLSAESAADAILAYVADEGIELIALTTRRRGAAARALFGSVADAVLHKAVVPVLVCHATGVGQTRRFSQRCRRPSRQSAEGCRITCDGSGKR